MHLRAVMGIWNTIDKQAEIFLWQWQAVAKGRALSM